MAAELARQTGTVWLSPDEWMSRLLCDGYDEERRAAVEEMQWELAKKLLSLGIDVILDNGFWSREERLSRRREAASIRADTRLHFLDVPLPELRRRIEMRNRRQPPWVVRVTDLETWSALFEAPTAEELASAREN